MKSIVFFNNKGGVGKTTFTFHLGYALERAGNKVLFVDLDPQCNLTAHICDEETIDKAWSEKGDSVYKAVEPIIKGAGDVKLIEPYKVENRNIWIFIGDLLLSDFEGELSNAWTQILAGQERGFRVTSAIYRIIQEFASKNDIDYILIDVAPNLGSLNRAVLLGCDNFVIPMIPDLFSLRGSQNLGRVFADWIRNYYTSKQRIGVSKLQFDTPNGTPKFSGYILQQFNVYRSRKTKAYERWSSQIPDYINEYVIGPLNATDLKILDLVLTIPDYKVADFKNYHGLVPMAQTSLKPIFELTSRDGVIGDHTRYVNDCRREFEQIANNIQSIIK
ncbi:Cellulose biosynthesis protein BcsQ [Chitinophaga rupis]|uniref:Cellulose biosynthesis protein BcsQ n=1 Tax=Chitinophaga rupis TaxID=573321 RepID=A0A1H7RPG0_9BACT|nr:AAA family ATPase [Chitinophaga rupis]SEL62093.1 Cellulose biosynthesis protein BcsQ [Chitinophaga rupis]